MIGNAVIDMAAAMNRAKAEKDTPSGAKSE